MKNSKSIIIILVVVVALAVLTYFFMSRTTVKREIDWTENYKPRKEIPYGILLIKDLLKTYHPDKKFKTIESPIRKNLSSKLDSTFSNYVFIGNSLELDSADIDSLLRFVEGGNNAFISTWSIPYELMDRLYGYECGKWEDYFLYEGASVNMNFYDVPFKTDNGFEFKYKYKNSNYKYNWRCVNGDYFCDSLKSFSALGYMDAHYVNYIRVPYGSGCFLLHTTPLVFCNYQMLEESSLDYAGKAFSYLNDGDIYWDEYSWHYSGEDEPPSGLSESPFKYILSQPALRWAWYLLLILVFIYVLFHAKRKQRAIPLMQSNTNTSLEFVKTIGRLHYQQQNHKNICRHKMKLFLSFIRSRYYLQTNNPDEKLMQKLCDKSEIPYAAIEKIFQSFKLVNYTIVSLTEEELVEFHQSIDYFYKNCK